MAYLLPTAPRSNTKWGLRGLRGRGLGYSMLPAMVDRTAYQYRTNGGTETTSIYRNPVVAPAPAPRPPIVVAKESPITAPKPLPIWLQQLVPKFKLDLPQPVKPVATPLPIVKPPAPLPAPVLPSPVLPKPPAVNAGTPVPTNYPVNQFYVANDGSVWEYSSSAGWFNTGTPYRAPAATTPSTTTTTTPAPSSAGSSGAVVSPSAPVNVSVPAADTGYQAILDWLTQDSLLATLGISGIPNWLAGGVFGLVGYKLVSGKGGR